MSYFMILEIFKRTLTTTDDNGQRTINLIYYIYQVLHYICVTIYLLGLGPYLTQCTRVVCPVYVFLGWIYSNKVQTFWSTCVNTQHTWYILYCIVLICYFNCIIKWLRVDNIVIYSTLFWEISGNISQKIDRGTRIGFVF